MCRNCLAGYGFVLLAAHGALAGVLVSRSSGKLQFTDVFAVLVQGKDKALSLGSDPNNATPLNKLSAVHLNGTLLKHADSGTLALYADGTAEFLLPQGLPKNASGPPAAIWRTAAITYKKSQSDKAPGSVPAEEFVAFVPDGTAGLARLCMDERAMELIGGKGKAFSMQMEFIPALVNAHRSDTAVAPLQKYIENAMSRRFEQFESGTASLDVLNQALSFAQLSAAVYPDDAVQTKLRATLAGRKAWIDRRVAILRAFAAAGRWDAFLLACRDLEPYELAFPEVLNKRNEALKHSLETHRGSGDQRMAEQEYGAAYREYRLATYRQPSDAVLQEEARQAWTEYSRRFAIDHQTKRASLSAGPRDAIARDLHFADRSKQDKKLDEALKNVLDAEAILRKAVPDNATAPQSLDILYKKAEILGAQARISEALAALDEYDLRAVDDERAKANQLRSELLYDLNKTLTEARAEVRKAWAESSFHRARELTLQGLLARDDDPELLYDAGVLSIITRDQQAGKKYLTKYLDVANALDANAGDRAKVRRLLPSLRDADTKTGATSGITAEGQPNWMSGLKLPPGVFYCAASLAFQPKIEHIDASNKLKVSFSWQGDRLQAIVPMFDKNEHVSGEKTIAFTYDEKAPMVIAAAYDRARPIAGDADEIVKRSSVVLANNPYVDPAAAGKLTGKDLALGIAGNRFFNPFVWEKIHQFRFTYDANGRVAQAREIVDQRGAAATLLEFDWDGMRLTAVRGYDGADERRRAKIYERTLQYDSRRLLSEEIQSEGKTSRIKYVYKGDRLISAACEKDLTLDGRQRQVFFAGNSPTTEVK